MPQVMLNEIPNDKQWVKVLYEHLISHPNPQTEVKTFSNKLRKEYNSEDFYSIITYTYRRLINEQQFVLATYIYDLFAYGEGIKYFYSAKEEGRMIVVKQVNAPVMVGKRKNVMAVKRKMSVMAVRGKMPVKRKKRMIAGKLVEKPVMAGKLVEKPVMAVKGKKVVLNMYEKEVKTDEKEVKTVEKEVKTDEMVVVKTDEKEVKTDEIMEMVNFEKIVDYCLHHCVNFNEIKPIYDMLLELLYGVKDERWFEAKKKIHQRMVQMETKQHITVEKGGELYLEKNVEYEVKYVDAGGTGISVNGKNDTNNL